jgi:transposase-like protein
MNVDLSDLCCVNSRCPDYGKRGAGNLICRKLVGKERWRFLRCRTCRQEFSARKGTPLVGLKMPTARAMQVWEHVADGCGVRQTSRLTRVSQGAVIRLTRQAGEHARKTHDEMARRLKVREVQLDEKWSFVRKKGGSVRSGQSRRCRPG